MHALKRSLQRTRITPYKTNKTSPCARKNRWTNLDGLTPAQNTQDPSNLHPFCPPWLKVLKMSLFLGLDAYLESWTTILELRHPYIGVARLCIEVRCLCSFFKEKVNLLFYFLALVYHMWTPIYYSQTPMFVFQKQNWSVWFYWLVHIKMMYCLQWGCRRCRRLFLKETN